MRENPCRQPSKREIEIGNALMTKRGWRDVGTPRLNQRLTEMSLPPGTVQTMLEFMMWLKAGVSLTHGEQPQPRRFSMRFDAFRARSPT
jgi:hypothetical protein